MPAMSMKEIKGMKARPSKKALERLYLDWLDESKIKAHEIGKRSKLGKLRLSILENGIRKYGVRGFARKLEVHEDTLRRYLKKAQEG